jgi:hypothetical protein
MSTYLTATALAFVALLYALDRFGYLPKKKTPADSVAELEIRDMKIERLETEIAEWKANKPLLELLKQIAETNSHVMDRLVHHNGSFKHMEESLREIGEGLKLITGFIAGVLEIPVKEKNT